MYCIMRSVKVLTGLFITISHEFKFSATIAPFVQSNEKCPVWSVKRDTPYWFVSLAVPAVASINDKLEFKKK